MMAVLCGAQPNVPFERVYDVPSARWTVATTMDDAGNIYTATQVNPDKNIQVTKILANAEPAWTKVYPFFVEMGIYNNSIAIGPSGLIVCGFALGTGTISRDAVIMRIDPADGTLLQSTRIDSYSESNAIHGITRINDGFIAVGRGRGGAGDYDMLLAKLDDSGAMLWSRTYGSTGWDWAEEAHPTPDGGFVLVGYGDSLNTPGIPPSGYVVKTDALGNELWARSISNGTRPDQPETMVVDAAGNIYIGGSSMGYGNLSDAASITKLSPAGNHLWTRYLEDGISTMRLLPMANGGIAWLLRPNMFPGGAGSYDMAWGTFDAAGNTTSSHYYGTEDSETPSGFFARGDGGFIIVGRVNHEVSENDPEYELAIIHTDIEGNSACNQEDIALNWQSATAQVQPFTSVTNSGYSTFNFPLGEESVTVGTTNPCCILEANFAIVPHSEELSWSFLDQSTNASTYFWDFGDGATSTDQSPSHLYSEAGTYTVCLTVTNACGEITSCQQLNTAVGIDEIAGEDRGIVVHPNPAKDVIYIRSMHSAILEVRLIDAAGRSVQESGHTRGHSAIMEVNNIPNGLYVVRVRMTNGTYRHHRVMVEH
jgi:hypothetical protein